MVRKSRGGLTSAALLLGLAAALALLAAIGVASYAEARLSKLVLGGLGESF